MEELHGKIEKINIPDRDLTGWTNDLREGGLSQKEIDLILDELNDNYFAKRFLYDEKFLDEKVNKIIQKLTSLGVKISQAYKNALRASLKNSAEDYINKNKQ